MALLDLLGRRWSLRILWELREEPGGFRALQARCDSMSPSVLSQRLGELQEAEIVRQAEQLQIRAARLATAVFRKIEPYQM